VTRPLRTLVAAGAVALAAAQAGCGLGAGDAPSGARLTVTRDFGAREVRRVDAPEVRGSETVMRFLQRNAKVATRYGGGFVQSIEGLGGGRERGRPVDWFFYVNGVEAPEGAAATRLRAGDRVWWDRHDWGAAMRVPAVVGSFPEPFLHGVEGRRFPVRVECADARGAACDEVVERLSARKIPAARGGLRLAQTAATLRVVVGPWTALRRDPALEALEHGPARSGVFARPARDGRAIDVLDARGRRTRTLGPGSGLVAATRDGEAPPVWTITGTDAAGVEAAARALEEGALGGRFALAVAGGRAVPVPEAAR